MIKVLGGEHIFEYRKELAQALRRIKEDKFIDGIHPCDQDAPLPRLLDVLPPPSVHHLDLQIYGGKKEDVILITTSDNYYIEYVQVRILDARGGMIEHGEAVKGLKGSNIWGYFATVSIPSLTEVTVRVAATDRLGGVGIGWAVKWIP
jgi:hypothetical protein